MSSSDFVNYQKFFNKEDAHDLAELLQNHGIEVEHEDSTGAFDPTFAHNASSLEFRIKLKKQDFDRADQVLMNFYVDSLDDIDSDYYMLKFSDTELYDVVAERDAWSKFDFLLAQKLLKERGKEVTVETIDALREERLEQLSQPDTNTQLWVYVGYFFALLGGLFGIFIGWHLFTFKKTLPNGNRVYEYSEMDRKHGQRIFYIGMISFAVWLMFRFLLMD